MSKILLKSVSLPSCSGKSKVKDVLIVDNVFSKISDSIAVSEFGNAEIVDCKNFALLPAFYNGHTHCAMSLLRGYADDMELDTWLKCHIWPFEAKLQSDDIYIGSRLAILEMIKSGTVFFADMYWHREQTIRAVEEMGLRAAIGVTFADALMTPEATEANFQFLKNHQGESERIKLVVMPHSIYTVGEATLKRCIEFAKEEHFLLHTHLSETAGEVASCKEQYKCSPVELFERLGGLGETFSAAHCVHFSKEDRQLFAESKSSAILNPCSNLKLSSGMPQIAAMLQDHVNIGLGTDGDSSNNNLDVREEMKFLALMAKVQGGADTLPAAEALKVATVNVAKAFGLKNAGEIREGALADGLLVDMNNERLVPNHNLISNWVHAADSSSIDSVICNGKFLMRNRHVDGEEEILREAAACAKRLAG